MEGSTKDALETRHRVSPLMLGITRALAWILLTFLYKFRSTGRERVPRDGPVILAPNHASYMDPPLVGYAARRRVFYLAWNQLFRMTLFGAYIRSLGAVPVDIRRGADKSAIIAALSLLMHGETVCIFPEGGRTFDGQLQPLRSGVARLAIRTGAPIVPVWIDGTFETWPRKRRFPRVFTRLTVSFLPAINARPAESPEEKKAEEQRLLNELQRSYASAHDTRAAHSPATSN